MPVRRAAIRRWTGAHYAEDNAYTPQHDSTTSKQRDIARHRMHPTYQHSSLLKAATAVAVGPVCRRLFARSDTTRSRMRDAGVRSRARRRPWRTARNTRPAEWRGLQACLCRPDARARPQERIPAGCHGGRERLERRLGVRIPAGSAHPGHRAPGQPAHHRQGRQGLRAC